jgi:WD40 repeat protein
VRDMREQGEAAREEQSILTLCLEVHKGHHGPVHCVRFSPDGETFGSGYASLLLIITIQALLTFPPFLFFFFLSSHRSEDGTVRIWQTSPKNYGLWQTTNATTSPSPNPTSPQNSLSPTNPASHSNAAHLMSSSPSSPRGVASNSPRHPAQGNHHHHHTHHNGAFKK